MADLRICFFGDSFVNGTGDPAMLGWVGRVCAAARAEGAEITAYNLGIRRDTSADVRAHWREEAKRRLPLGVEGRLVFSFGANDSVVEGERPRVDPAVSVANLRAILQDAVRMAPTLMVGPPPLGDAVRHTRLIELCDSFAALCGEMAVPYLPVCRPLIARPTWLDEAAAGDGAHPGAGGYAALAGLVTGWADWKKLIRPAPP